MVEKYEKIEASLTSVASYISTDLGNLIGNTQCGNFRFFSATQILREINFGHFEAPKTG